MLRGMVLLLEIFLVDTVIALDSKPNKGRNAKTLISLASNPVFYWIACLHLCAALNDVCATREE